MPLAENALAAASIAGAGEIQKEIVRQFRGRLLPQFLGGHDSSGELVRFGNALPGRPILDGRANALGLLWQPLGDLGNPFGVEWFG